MKQETAASEADELELRWRDHWKRTSNQLQRLQLALAVVGPRILDRGAKGQPPSSAAERVCQAKEALARRNPDVGWARLHSAIELECLGFTQEEVDAAALILSNELRDGALAGWEASAIGELLAHLGPSELPPSRKSEGLDPESLLEIRRMYLQQALRLRNSFFASAYYVERTIAHRRLILVSVGIALLVTSLVILLLAPSEWKVPDYRIALGSAVAGMVGAVTSASQRLVAHPDTAAPIDLGSFTAVVVRLFIGAVAALSVYLAELSGFVTFPGDEVAMLLLASFGVGFAERLVVYHPPQATVHPSSTATATLPRRV